MATVLEQSDPFRIPHPKAERIMMFVSKPFFAYLLIRVSEGRDDPTELSKEIYHRYKVTVPKMLIKNSMKIMSRLGLMKLKRGVDRDHYIITEFGKKVASAIRPVAEGVISSIEPARVRTGGEQGQDINSILSAFIARELIKGPIGSVEIRRRFTKFSGVMLNNYVYNSTLYNYKIKKLVVKENNILKITEKGKEWLKNKEQTINEVNRVAEALFRENDKLKEALSSVLLEPPRKHI